MSARNVDPADEWPLPPPWMWGCGKCTDLYRAMKQAPKLVDAALEELGPGIDCDPHDSIVSTQIRLARHIATRHVSELPEADEECERCVSDASGNLPAVLALEHRARHLFAPPSIVDML
ncbi:hypothetical protein ACWC5C_18325 [Streptomyces sp. NPDC001700]|uniref:hypothetical protein n=1 Tax=Streptomyces sp. NPDC059850 TaxID=3346970 RepID=UPI00366605A1